MKLLKGKVATVIILIATFVLAGVAVFTAIRLYQLRQVPVAPNVPESAPQAGGVVTPRPVLCSLTFSIATPTPSPSPTPAPTSTPVASCNSACTTSSQCPTGLTCSAGFCRKSICTAQENCVCVTPTPTATATPTATPSPTATPTSTPVVTNSPTPTPTQVPQCNNNCTSNSECPTDLMCNIAEGAVAGNCRNASCTDKADCTCTVDTPTPTSTVIAQGTPVPTPVPTQPALPQSGTDWATYFGIGIGILTIIGAFVLAL